MWLRKKALVESTKKGGKSLSNKKKRRGRGKSKPVGREHGDGGYKQTGTGARVGGGNRTVRGKWEISFLIEETVRWGGLIRDKREPAVYQRTAWAKQWRPEGGGS